ncbi:hypothetical protein U9M48_013689 [Paspalum notatum var. saurae]|uniref:Uncharacterized protein n=1 Tax=Paspalum notatum var. saurae TaxID=547442 RepID=A0AAQ3WJP7_PASNO
MPAVEPAFHILSRHSQVRRSISLSYPASPPVCLTHDADHRPIKEELLEKWSVDEWPKHNADRCANDKLMSGFFTVDMPVTKLDLIDVICDCIMAIEDYTTLE